MTRKILSAETRSNWTAIAGALEGALAFLGEPLDRQTVMGLSGHAFRLAITTTASGIASADSAVHIDYERALGLHASLGFAMRRAAVSQFEPDYGRRRAEAIRAIVRSIDRGRPVIASGLHVADFGIVKGYDDRAAVIYVSTAVSLQYGDALPLSQWPPPGATQPLEIMLPGDRLRIDRRQAEVSALRFAVDYALQGDPAGPKSTAHGLAAYARWLAGYAGLEPLDRFGNARCLQTLQAARRDAAGFLRGISAQYAEPAKGALQSAAVAYETEALALSRLTTLFPFPSGGETEDARVLGAPGLQTAMQNERQAIACLQQALVAL